MKLSRLLLPLALLGTMTCASAFAGEEKTLVETLLDLDQDGKPDHVRVVQSAFPRNPKFFFRTLEIALSKDQRVLRFPNLMDNVNEGYMEGCSHEIGNTGKSAVDEDTRPVSLKKVSPTSFVLHEGSTEFDGCSSYFERELRIGVVGNRLVVEKMKSSWYEWHMGGESHSYFQAYDFLLGKAQESEVESGEEKPERKWRIPPRCKAMLRVYSKSGIPTCAKGTIGLPDKQNRAPSEPRDGASEGPTDEAGSGSAL